MADGNIFRFPTALREVPSFTSSGAGDHPQANIGTHGFRPVEPLDREPAPAFEIDRRAGCVTWTLTGLRLREADDFRQLANLFLTNHWPRNFNALNDAELALSDPGPEAA